ncbi:hypothetical protein PROFUN_05212 [Planoprotostelium fungivorum]|uniref:Right handed beta helix domain-containing protein n=1 Tax=Planoprotostelium fungivorum TaxID=1890364 RepID=A0A2P6NRI2_9EUKA|nr:hypothetical protein PROFUN_05212 [Planoprotostelium fungivorum]
MFFRTLCFSLLLCIVASCDVFVDGQRGNDTSTCGAIDSPCKNIPQLDTEKEVCLKSGLYEITEVSNSIPNRMRWWKVEGEEGERPTLNCTGRGAVHSDFETDLAWMDVRILQSCSGAIFANSIQFHSVVLEADYQTVNVSITDSMFYCSFLWFSIQYDPSAPNEQTFFLLKNNVFLSGDYQISADAPTQPFSARPQISHNVFGINASMTVDMEGWNHLEVFNNTCQDVSSQSSLSIDWRVQPPTQFLRQMSFNISLNRLTSFKLEAQVDVLPQFDFQKNNFSSSIVKMQSPQRTEFLSNEDRHRFTIQGNTLHSSEWQIWSRNTWVRENASVITLEMMDNDMGDVRMSIRKMGFWIQENVIERLVLVKEASEDNEDTSLNLLTSNTIHRLDYSVAVSPLGPELEFEVRDNAFQEATLSAVSTLSSVLNFTENTFTGTNGTFNALSISQMRGFTAYISMSDVRDYNGAGILCKDIEDSVVYIDRVNVSNCRSGGIRVNLYNSQLNVHNCTVHNNTSPSDGGGIALFGDNAAVDISQSNLTQNFASHASCLMGSLGRDSSVQLRDVYMTVADNVTTTDHSVVVLTSKYNTSQVNMECTDGSFLDAREQEKHLRWSCSLCESGSYTLGRGMIVADEKMGTLCRACPLGAICEEGKPILGRGDFWCGAADDQLECRPCPNGYCSHDNHPWQQPCVGDRNGTLCGGCTEDKTLGFLTSSCLPTYKCKPQLLAVASLLPFLYSAVLMALPIGDGSIWKSTSYFIQTVPLLVNQAQKNEIINTLSSLLFTPTTSHGGSALSFCVGTFDYVQKEVMSLYLPLGTVIILSLISLFFCIVGVLARRKKLKAVESVTSIEWRGRSWRSRSTTALVGALLLVYSGVVSSCLKLLFCVEIEPGVWVMHNDGTERCDQAWRTALIVFSSVILVPSPVILLFLRRKLRISSGTISRDVLVVVEGCYRDGCKYWESIYMVRRLAIALIYVFVTNERWVMPAMHLLMMASLAAHLVLKPFVTPIGQTIETVCLACLAVITLPIYQPNLATDVAIQILIAAPIVVSVGMMAYKISLRLRERWRRPTQAIDLADYYFVVINTGVWFSSTSFSVDVHHIGMPLGSQTNENERKGQNTITHKRSGATDRLEIPQI